MKTEVEGSKLGPFLRQLGAATVLSIAMATSAGQVVTNMTSSYQFAAAAEQHPDVFGDGPYIVKYEEPEKKTDAPQDLEMNTFAVAFTFQAKLANSDRLIGGLDSLLTALADFQYLARIKDEPSWRIGHVLIVMPTDPAEVEKLKQILQANAVHSHFPDGTNELSLVNAITGDGVWKA
ncbi:TPA: hypothetical protein SL272_000841 [Pseudomonas aeruginosa]|nr:hypothetical protein [Pseudomonas aeruginosa]